MTIYIGLVGELILVEIFVFLIWLRVLFDAVVLSEPTVAAKRLLLTSLGLVFNAFSITGIMTIRAFQLSMGTHVFILPISIFYTVLAIGNILFIISASLGESPRLIKAFVLLTILWAAMVCFLSYF